MKILQITAIDLTVYRFLVPLMDRMRQEGWEVHFACADGDKARKVEAMGFIFHPIRTTRRLHPAELLIELRDMFRLFRRLRPNIVHLHTPIAAFVGRFAAKAARVPFIVYTAHGFYHQDDMNMIKRNFFASLEWLAGKIATDLLFVFSRDDFEWATSAGFMPKGRIVCIGNGTNLIFFSPSSVNQEIAGHLRQEIGPGRIILACGRAVREKGFFELVEASAEVIREFPDAVFVLAGQGPDLDGLRDHAERLGVLGKWRFLGWREEMRELLWLSEIFVLPSWREGMPRSIIEAMAMERPVVTTDIRGCREEVVHGETGFLVPPKEPKTLADAIVRLLSDRGLARQMGVAGRTRAEQLFDERAFIEKQIHSICARLKS